MIMAADQTSGMARRKAGVMVAACDAITLNKLANKFPDMAWSNNHYQWGEAELLGKNFVDVTWGPPTYTFLLEKKMQYDPQYKFMCAYDPAWPPISQDPKYLTKLK